MGSHMLGGSLILGARIFEDFTQQIHILILAPLVNAANIDVCLEQIYDEVDALVAVLLQESTKLPL
jgi:hypothetical protein